MYTKVNWKDGTDQKSTPLSAKNLGHMDDQIEANANEIDSLKARPVIYSGTTVPAASLGKVGDIYFRRL